MVSGQSNVVVVLANYRKANGQLELTDVKTFLETEREEVRKFDLKVYELLRRKHKIKIAEDCRNAVLEHEQALLVVSDWLSDKLDQATGVDKEQYEKLSKECGKLIERNERTKKNIVDDLAACRHYENKRELVKILGFALVTPLTVFNLVKAIAPTREDLAWTASLAGAVLGSTVAFHHQAGQMLSHTAKAVGYNATHIKKISKATRTSFVSAAITISVATKEIREIKPSSRPQEMHRPEIVYSAHKYN